MSDIILTLCDMITKLWVVKWIFSNDDSDDSYVEENSGEADDNIKK